jgi:hypothetical protein
LFFSKKKVTSVANSNGTSQHQQHSSAANSAAPYAKIENTSITTNADQTNKASENNSNNKSANKENIPATNGGGATNAASRFQRSAQTTPNIELTNNNLTTHVTQQTGQQSQTASSPNGSKSPTAEPKDTVVNIGDISLQTVNETESGKSNEGVVVATTVPTTAQPQVLKNDDSTAPDFTGNGEENDSQNLDEGGIGGEVLTTTTASIKLATPSGIPVASSNNSNRFITSASSTAATPSFAKSNATAPQPPQHQRAATNASGVVNGGGSNTVKLKKSDTGRGALDFLPKSASTDKSRLEGLLTNRNIPTTSALNAAAASPPNSIFSTPQQQTSGGDTTAAAGSAIRASHSYRTKAEILQQNSHIPQQQASAATAIGGASLLTSNLNSHMAANNGSGNIKSQSAVPIKQNNDNVGQSANNSNSQKTDTRPR